MAPKKPAEAATPGKKKKLEFIVQLTIENVGEASCLPAVKCCEFGGRLGEFVTVYRRDGKPVPYIEISNSMTN